MSGPGDAALAAADHLMTRVLEPAGIIQAWGDLDDPRQRGRTIIDSLMNTPLLFWASQTTGDDALRRRGPPARRQLREHILRPDDTTFHTFYWDPATGAPLRGETEQGSADDSCWARGQAWGIYGFSLNHRHTGDPALLVAAQRCADYFLAHLPADQRRLLGPGVRRRQRPGAGQLGRGHRRLRPARTRGHLTDDRPAPPVPRSRRPRSCARSSTTTPPPAHPVSNALILHGVYDKPKGVGVDEGTLWGDYFYLEALTRATIPGWTSPW